MVLEQCRDLLSYFNELIRDLGHLGKIDSDDITDGNLCTLVPCGSSELHIGSVCGTSDKGLLIDVVIDDDSNSPTHHV